MINFDAGKWQNLDEISADSLMKELRVPAEQAMKMALVRFEGIVKETLTGARSGRTYKVSQTGALHVASAPGEPPAVRMGNLRNSVGHSGPRWEGGTVSGEVGPGLGQAPSGDDPDPSKSYARRLELGGADSRGIMIEPRPYMAPSGLKAEPQMELIFRQFLEAR
jgi:hypothetical protein